MKRWIAGILCVSCLLMMTACSRNGEEVSGSQEESSQVMESSSESVEQPSEDSQPEETAEPEELRNPFVPTGKYIFPNEYNDLLPCA